MQIEKIHVTKGVYFLRIPAAELNILCGCPSDVVKHLMKHGLIVTVEQNGVTFETGPNAILLSDVMLQSGVVANMAEFPVLQMLYRQGMLIPDHPNNTGERPLIIGSAKQVKAQMEYIYRGNYGLVSEEEMLETGLDAKTAHNLMRIKLKFAFGSIHGTERLLDSLVVDDGLTTVRNGVTIRRTATNVFEFTYGGETVSVDLNLAQNEEYEPPYFLGMHNIPREYFAVIHAGEGDGWDINRTCMSSILMFHGKIYLIDAGPNILYNLKSLGIGLNEIEGLFHTHAHDDHFAGLTDIIGADHRIRYFSTPLVRASVTKKLSALLSIDESRFHNLFDVHDLAFDEWNIVDGLEVKPVLSPHPVETNIFFFRAMWAQGYKTYAHFADIASFDVLEDMLTDDPNENGISQAYYEDVKQTYLTTTDIKKIDVGGGMIHGEAADFRDDQSGKMILAHKANALTTAEEEIGSAAPYGTVDVLIPNYQTYTRRNAFQFLRSYFPNIAHEQLSILLNNPLEVVNPETILIKEHESNETVYLILTGDVEMINTKTGVRALLASGALMGEQMALHGLSAAHTFRTRNFVNVLTIPTELFRRFIRRNDLFKEFSRLDENRYFLRSTWLFGQSLSYKTQNIISQEMELRQYAEHDAIVEDGDKNYLHVIKSGAIHCPEGYDAQNNMLLSGEYFGDSSILFGAPLEPGFRAACPTSIHQIPVSIVCDIPIVRWKLLETYQRRTGNTG